jgi:hypothetical protein
MPRLPMNSIKRNISGIAASDCHFCATHTYQHSDVYRIRAFLADKLANVTRVSAGSDGEIMRDVIRTFQKQKFFQRYQPGQRMLLHILFALVAARPDVGYCQVRPYLSANGMEEYQSPIMSCCAKYRHNCAACSMSTQ